MANLHEINRAIKVLYKSGLKKNLTLLHCRSSYPTKLEDLNLKSINYLKKFNCKVGLSDHTEEIEASIMATCLDAKIIEKHFIK